jgi:hypothetical protein
LNLTQKLTARDTVLEDLAVAFSEVGMNDAARDSHLILANTAQLKWVRWQATINLMELAAQDGMLDAFNSYAAELRNAPMGPWLKSHFLLFLGEGLDRFERYEAAEQALSEAIDYATANQIHSVSFKADDVLAAVRSRSRRPTKAPIFTQMPDEVLAAAHAVSELRKVALSQA